MYMYIYIHTNRYIYICRLYELAFDDDNSCLIRQLNGVFVLGLPLPPPPCASSPGDTFIDKCVTFIAKARSAPPGRLSLPADPCPLHSRRDCVKSWPSTTTTRASSASSTAFSSSVSPPFQSAHFLGSSHTLFDTHKLRVYGNCRDMPTPTHNAIRAKSAPDMPTPTHDAEGLRSQVSRPCGLPPRGDSVSPLEETPGES